jgi:D-alanyl-D-alanine carboxypeptidase/D-alanyl-D-alanine-endopeptidase (penicillin-binding protein 4)
MQNANSRGVASTKPLLSVFGILHFALLVSAGCARSPVAVAPPQPVDPIAQLRNDITAATYSPGVQRAAWGIVVQSLDTSERLFELNPTTLLVPASTLKLVSLAAAVDAVGWQFSFTTNLRTTGPVAGVIAGDLIVQGTGDPSIGGRGGRDITELVDRIKAAGVRQIDGRIIGDDNLVEEPRPQLAWAWDDLGYSTGALFGALNYAENRMEVTVQPGATQGDLSMLQVAPQAASRPIQNRTTTGPVGSSPFVWPEQRPGEPFLTIAGSVPAGAAPARIQVSVGNPTLWFATALRHALLDAGITVAGEAYDIDDAAVGAASESAATFSSVASASLAELARPLLKDSINLYGEAVLRLSARCGVFPTNDAALAGLRETLDRWGVRTDAWQIVDGSGLSRRNAVAPEVLVAVLRRMYDPSGGSPWMNAMPVAGRDGTLADRMRGTAAEANVRAKTGTMSNIRTLAGYVRTRDGEALAFAIMADNFEGSGSTAVQAIDSIAVRLAEFSRRH